MKPEMETPKPKRGLVLLHKRIIYPDINTPAKMVVTCLRSGVIYYRFLGGGGHEYVTLERWPHVAAPLGIAVKIGMTL